MKKALSVLVLDTDTDSSTRIMSTVKDIFSRLNVQNSHSQFERDCLGLKPDILLMNLNIDQRDGAFNFLEALSKTTDKLPVVFGYADAVSSEFIAHSIENGIMDVFARPFDSDIIASKINRVVKSEETSDRDLSYTKLAPTIASTIEMSFRIKSVEENGMTLQSPHHISKGARVSVTASIMKEIFGVDSLPMIVTKTWFDEQSSAFYLFAEPKDQSDKTISGLRNFLNSKI